MSVGDDKIQVTHYRFHGFTLDVCKRCLFDAQGNEVPLSTRALDTLQILVTHRGEMLTKRFLVENIWPGIYVDENNLNQAITGIRKALGDSKSEGRFIKTVTGRGYCFVAELDDVVTSSVPGVDDQFHADAEETAPDDHHRGVLSLMRQHTASVARPGLVVTTLLCGLLGGGWILSKWWVTEPAVTEQDVSAANYGPLANRRQEKLPNSIAVLPLKSLNPATDQFGELFAIGLHNELINQLSNLPKLNVISRRSVLNAGVQDLTLPEIGERLRVKSVLTGNLLFVEDRIRINLQMLDAETRMVQWTFEHDVDASNFTDLLYTQREVALKVTDAMHDDPDVNGLLLAEALPTESFEAYRYTLAAERAFLNENFAKSLSLSSRALAADPDYPEALYNFSRANYFLASNPVAGMTTQGHLQQGLESSQRLIELAPADARGYVLKTIALANTGRWSEAMAEVQRLQGNEAISYRDLSLLAPTLMSLGLYQTTIEILEANLETEPLNSYGRGFLMAAYEATGNSVQARLAYETGEELTPDWWGDIVNVFLSLGRGESIDHIQGFESEETRSLLEKFNAGDHDALRAELQAVANADFSRSSLLVHGAALAATIGEHALAIRLMARATSVMPTHLHWIWLPVFRETRKQPGIEELLTSTGLRSYWQQAGSPDVCRGDNEALCQVAAR